jgi:putative phosphoribosyl transferase
VVVCPDGLGMPGHLTVPRGTRAALAHGAGAPDTAPATVVAARMHEARSRPCRSDLPSPDEALGRSNVFDVELLAVRLLVATRWARRQPRVRDGLAVCYFGASTGRARHCGQQARTPRSPQSSRGRASRPCRGPVWSAVSPPTRLIVGGDDAVVLAAQPRGSREPPL